MESESQKLWNVDLEVSLFHAMRKHKPVGTLFHLFMKKIAYLYHKF